MPNRSRSVMLILLLAGGCDTQQEQSARFTGGTDATDAGPHRPSGGSGCRRGSRRADWGGVCEGGGDGMVWWRSRDV